MAQHASLSQHTRRQHARPQPRQVVRLICLPFTSTSSFSFFRPSFAFIIVPSGRSPFAFSVVVAGIVAVSLAWAVPRSMRISLAVIAFRAILLLVVLASVTAYSCVLAMSCDGGDI